MQKHWKHFGLRKKDILVQKLLPASLDLYANAITFLLLKPQHIPYRLLAIGITLHLPPPKAKSPPLSNFHSPHPPPSPPSPPYTDPAPFSPLSHPLEKHSPHFHYSASATLPSSKTLSWWLCSVGQLKRKMCGHHHGGRRERNSRLGRRGGEMPIRWVRIRQNLRSLRASGWWWGGGRKVAWERARRGSRARGFGVRRRWVGNEGG